MSPALDLRPALPADWRAVTALLEDNELPLAGVREHLDNFTIARLQDVVVGCAGLEIYGDCGLLRSVAVAPLLKGRGIGRALVERVLETGRERGLAHLYLLTVTAADYFQKHGFTPAQREAMPARLNESAEFRGACPASAALLHLPLPPA